MQNEVAELIGALYAASPTETTVYLRQITLASEHPQTRVSMRRILSRLPESLQEELSQHVRPQDNERP
jgi:hypothetical protein